MTPSGCSLSLALSPSLCFLFMCCVFVATAASFYFSATGVGAVPPLRATTSSCVQVTSVSGRWLRVSVWTGCHRGKGWASSLRHPQLQPLSGKDHSTRVTPAHLLLSTSGDAPPSHIPGDAPACPAHTLSFSVPYLWLFSWAGSVPRCMHSAMRATEHA